MNYTLIRLPPAQSAATVAEIQRRDSNQRWGVWGAVEAMSPGSKIGRAQARGGWVVTSVGFADPPQRYSFAVMSSLEGEGGYEDGVETTSRLAQMLLSAPRDCPQ